MTYSTISNDDLLIKVKQALGINGDYQNDTLSIYIDEVKYFLDLAGVSETTINSTVCVGIICRGVADLWNYGNGNAQLSDYFKMRVSQLVLGEKVTPIEETINKKVNEVIDTINNELDEIIDLQNEVFEND